MNNPPMKLPKWMSASYVKLHQTSEAVAFHVNLRAVYELISAKKKRLSIYDDLYRLKEHFKDLKRFEKIAKRILKDSIYFESPYEIEFSELTSFFTQAHIQLKKYKVEKLTPNKSPIRYLVKYMKSNRIDKQQMKEFLLFHFYFNEWLPFDPYPGKRKNLSSKQATLLADLEYKLDTMIENAFREIYRKK